MAILEELIREIDRKPEKAKALLDKLSEVDTRLSIALQLSRFADEMVTLREDFNRMSEEIRQLREEQVRLREEQVRLREDFNRMSNEIKQLREDFNRMMGVVGGLQEDYRSMKRLYIDMRSALVSGFGELCKFAGVTFEQFVRKFLTNMMREAWRIPGDKEFEKVTVDGEEINLFLDEPLTVGEVTSYAESDEDVKKLLRKAEIVRKKYGREPRKILVILTATSQAASRIKQLARDNNIELIIGKEVKQPS